MGALGVGRTEPSVTKKGRETNMKVRVYPEEGGTFSVLIEPSIGRGLPPVLLQGLTKADLKGKVSTEIIRLRRPEVQPPPTGF